MNGFYRTMLRQLRALSREELAALLKHIVAELENRK